MHVNLDDGAGLPERAEQCLRDLLGALSEGKAVRTVSMRRPHIEIRMPKGSELFGGEGFKNFAVPTCPDTNPHR